MRRLRASIRVVLAAAVLALVLLTAWATAVGYLVEAHNVRGDRAYRLAAAAAYVGHHAAQAETTRWQQAVTRELTALGLRAQLTMAWLGGKRLVYASSDLVAATPSARRPASDAAAATPSSPSAGQPTATYLFPLAQGYNAELVVPGWHWNFIASAIDHSILPAFTISRNNISRLRSIPPVIGAHSAGLSVPLRNDIAPPYPVSVAAPAIRARAG